MSVANIRKLQENTAALVQNGCSPIRVGGYQRIRIRPSGEFETPPLPSGLRIPDVNIRGGMWAVAEFRNVMAAEQNITSRCKVAVAGYNGGTLPLSGCEASGWNVSG